MISCDLPQSDEMDATRSCSFHSEQLYNITCPHNLHITPVDSPRLADRSRRLRRQTRIGRDEIVLDMWCDLAFDIHSV